MADDEKLHGKNPVPRLAGRYIKWTAYGLLVRLLLRNNLLSALLLVGGALLFQGLADWFFTVLLLGRDSPLYVLLHMTLPDLLYSLVLAPLIYALVTGVTRLLRHRE